MTRKKATILIAILLVASSSLGQQRTTLESESPRLRNFTAVKGRPEHMPTSFEFSTSSHKYIIASNGRGRRAASDAGSQLINLRLHKGYSLERNIYYAEYEGDILSAGRILGGQGRREMTLDTTGLDGQTITVTVERLDSLAHASFASCKVQISTGQQESQTWEPNKAFLKRLDSPKEIEEFQLNPPRDYTPQTSLGPHGSKATVWVGPLRRDGTRPQVMVLAVTLPPEEVKQYTLEHTLSTLMERLSHQRKDWSRTSAEKGMINGLPFMRARWSGTDLILQRKMYGFNYVTIVGDKLIQLSSQDVEPHNKEALDLAESSALTFKKR